MTATSYPFDVNVLGRCATRIINEVKGINRVVYGVTSKPPGRLSGSEERRSNVALRQMERRR